MPYAQLNDVRLHYQFAGPEGRPCLLQLGGSLFGRRNFSSVNGGFKENFRLLSFDMRGYGASDHPRERYTIEGWADDVAALLDAAGLDRVLVHGASMGGMIALAFTAKYPERTIASCATAAFAKPDRCRRTMLRVWRRMAETMPWDDLADHVTTQAVGADFMEGPEGQDVFALVRQAVGLNDAYTVRQACVAMETMDLSAAARKVSRPLLMINSSHDVLCPPELAAPGLDARRLAAMNEHIKLVEFSNVGHAILLERPTEVVRVVNDFFEEVLAVR